MLFRGATLGTTPLAEAPVVPAGRHLVTVKRPGFKPAGAFVNVTEEGHTASVNLKLTEAVGEYSRSALVAGDRASFRQRFDGKGVPR